MRKLLLITVIFFTQLIIAQPVIELNPGDTLKVHPLGDSITRGKAGDNYRHYLKSKLRTEAKIEIDYVGQCTHAADVGSTWEDQQDLYNLLEGDVEHDGWGGLTIQQLTDMSNNTKGYPKKTVEQLIDDSPADVILLMIGTNNKFFAQYSEGAEEALKTLIGRIVDTTDTYLIVSTIPPTSLTLTNGRIEEFNATVPGTVDSFKTLGKNISFIDINSYMDPVADILDDFAHPSPSGNEHIADGWYDALLNIVSDVKDEKKNEIPNSHGLRQNYPNPFNPVTVISFTIPEQTATTIKVFDVLGNEITTLLNEVKSAGEYEINFDASNLSSGIYLYKLTTDSFTDIKQMMLLK